MDDEFRDLDLVEVTPGYSVTRSAARGIAQHDRMSKVTSIAANIRNKSLYSSERAELAECKRRGDAGLRAYLDRRGLPTDDITLSVFKRESGLGGLFGWGFLGL